jgi:hypothetical protein
MGGNLAGLRNDSSVDSCMGFAAIGFGSAHWPVLNFSPRTQPPSVTGSISGHGDLASLQNVMSVYAVR